jgi:hypothetical protein
MTFATRQPGAVDTAARNAAPDPQSKTAIPAENTTATTRKADIERISAP